MLPIARWAQRRRRQQHTTPGCPALSSPEWSASVPAGLRQLLDATFAQESEEVRTAVLQHFVDLTPLKWASAPRAIGMRRDVPTARPPARLPACPPACLPACRPEPAWCEWQVLQLLLAVHCCWITPSCAPACTVCTAAGSP